MSWLLWLLFLSAQIEFLPGRNMAVVRARSSESNSESKYFSFVFFLKLKHSELCLCGAVDDSTHYVAHSDTFFKGNRNWRRAWRPSKGRWSLSSVHPSTEVQLTFHKCQVFFFCRCGERREVTTCESWQDLLFTAFTYNRTLFLHTPHESKIHAERFYFLMQMRKIQLDRGKRASVFPLQNTTSHLHAGIKILSTSIYSPSWPPSFSLQTVWSVWFVQTEYGSLCFPGKLSTPQVAYLGVLFIYF